MRTTKAAFLFIAILSALTSVHAQYRLTGDKIKNISVFNKPVAADKAPLDSVPGRCGFALLMNKAKQHGFNENEFEALLDGLIQERKKLGSKTTVIYTVPLIFHVIHRGEAVGTVPNISAAKVTAQIAQLNNDFSNLAGSAYGVASDMGLRFCAALVDTSGKLLAEPGLERLNGITKGWNNTASMSQASIDGYFASTIKPQSIWNPHKYVNIWTADITSSNLLGWATFPGLSTLTGLDNTENDLTAGLVLAAGSIGSVANPGPLTPYHQGKTATHEMGHFFGLRHIWGDTNCGTDYCNDTPVQSGPTTGCPASPAANNCIPAANKMFENYMDYSYDACMNTFTTDQTSRAQIVMLNSPRRVELVNSLACTARPGNSIQFTSDGVMTSETGTTGTCPLTKTITVTVLVASQATGSATVNFTLGGTAINGNDYTISPSSISYTAGDGADKTITITILDDKAAESTETLVLGYSITGTGVVSGIEKQNFTLSIIDDDYVHTINETTPGVTFFSENFDGSTNLPSGWTTQSNGGANVWVVSANGGNGTTINAAHITDDLVNKTNTYDNGSASQAFLISPLINASGVNSINLSFKWRCRGESSGGVDYDAGYVGYILPSNPTVVNLLSTVFNGQSGPAATYSAAMPTAVDGTPFYLVFYWVNDAAAGNSPGFTVDVIQITGQRTTVESTVSTSVTSPQYSGGLVQYISSDNEIIATVANADQNIGCVTATVQNAGTGRSVINTPAGSYFRTDKVVRLTPATPNGTVNYQGTIYFTTGELSPAWSPSEIPNLKILKVKDGVSLTGTVSSADAVLVTPTFSDNSASGYYSYTGNFTGFSQFMAVSPTFALPVELVSFEARAEQTSILLQWTTSAEANNKGFAIERSTNAVDYEKIGWVDGKGTSSAESNYTFRDQYVQTDIVYYYRLRQTDFDGREKISPVRQAKIAGSGLELIVSPNPASDEVKIFIKGKVTNGAYAEISLVNSIGQLSGHWSGIRVGNPASISVRHLPKGYYRVIVHLKDGNLNSQLIID